jgi:hypothetical protein
MLLGNWRNKLTDLLTEEFDGGSTLQFNDNGVAKGWVAKRKI